MLAKSLEATIFNKKQENNQSFNEQLNLFNQAMVALVLKIKKQLAYSWRQTPDSNKWNYQDIRDVTNKIWALGDEPFNDQISNILSRRAKPSPQGGDRRSKAFNASKIKWL
jgi:hypothetical protein